MSTFSVSDIINGNVDDALGDISEAVSMRRKTLRQRQQQINLLSFSQGDRVRTKNLSPKYASGLTGTIVSKNRTKFVLEFDDGQYTGRFGKRVTVPAECLEAING